MISKAKSIIPWWQTSFDNGEDFAVTEAIKAKKISQGSVTKHFEELLADYLGVQSVIATSSGTSALTLALMGSDIKPGDEVLVPNRTWIATAHAVQILGGVPVFVDTEVDFPVMSVIQLEKYLTPKTKAIMPVHMNGRGVDMTELNQFAEEHGLVVIEDAAQALGSKNVRGQFLGTLSTAGCFSLSVAKIIATGQGGFLATKDPDLAKRFRSLRTHGVENTVEPDRWVAPGSNFRFTDILASIGIIQLALLPERIKRSRQVYERYKVGLKNHPSVQLIEYKDYEVGPYIEVLAQNRDGLRNYLRVQPIEIETRPFYPDLNSAPYWVERNSEELPNSMKFAARGLYLPSGPSILDEDIDYVLGAIWKFDS